VRRDGGQVRILPPDKTPSRLGNFVGQFLGPNAVVTTFNTLCRHHKTSLARFLARLGKTNSGPRTYFPL